MLPSRLLHHGGALTHPLTSRTSSLLARRSVHAAGSPGETRPSVSRPHEGSVPPSADTELTDNCDLDPSNPNPGLGAAIRAAKAEEVARPRKGTKGPVAAVDAAKKADRSGILRQGNRTSFGDEDEGQGVIARAGKKLKEAATKATGAILGEKNLDAYSAAAYKSLKSHAEEKEAGTAEMSRSTAQLGSDATARDKESKPVMGMQDEKGQLYNDTKEKK